MRRTPSIVFATALLWLAACASAGDGDDDDGTPGGPDAAIGFPDAPTGGFPDAPTGGFPDAPIFSNDAGSGLFCQDNSDCPKSDECCFILVDPPGFCTPGTDIGGVCFPSS